LICNIFDVTYLISLLIATPTQIVQFNQSGETFMFYV